MSESGVIFYAGKSEQESAKQSEQKQESAEQPEQESAEQESAAKTAAGISLRRLIKRFFAFRIWEAENPFPIFCLNSLTKLYNMYIMYIY